jgi:hypothetical protein
MAKQSLKKTIKTLSRKSTPENLDKLDRFRAFYFEGIQLKPSEKEELNKFRMAITFYHNFPSKQATVNYMMTHYGISESHAYLVLRSSIKLFGDVLHTDKKGERVASYEFYMQLAEEARKEKDIETAMKCRERADKVIGLFDPDHNLPDPKDLMPAVIMKFSDDIETLKAAIKQKHNVIDIGHEEVG